MPYTPPTGNAVNFRFASAYLAPTGGNVRFAFGSGVVPPQTLALPTGLAQARQGDDDWLPQLARRYAPITSAPPASGPLPWMRPAMPAAIFDDAEWVPPLRRRFAPIVSAYTARTILFVIT